MATTYFTTKPQMHRGERVQRPASFLHVLCAGAAPCTPGLRLFFSLRPEAAQGSENTLRAEI